MINVWLNAASLVAPLSKRDSITTPLKSKGNAISPPPKMATFLVFFPFLALETLPEGKLRPANVPDSV
tara:strand:+ start:775 stop:978 length:204 start_codon:yes stop_codon:yes gene_type:complete